MRHAMRFAALAALTLLAACAHSIRPDDVNALKADNAVVILAVKSAIPLTEARKCSGICTAWYELDAHHDDIYAFPARVGSTFKLTQVHTADQRVGPLKGSELKIDRPGIYFYGTIRSTHASVGLSEYADPAVLMEAWAKFGPALSTLAPVNFAWPSADSAPSPFHYLPSPVAQARLKALMPAPAAVAVLAPAADTDLSCRMGLELSRPDQLRQEEYVRRALNAELKDAGWYDERGAAWKGRLTTLKISTTPGAWDLGVELESPTGARVAAAVHHPFRAGFATASACAAGEDSWRPAVQALVEQLVVSPQFEAFAGTRAVEAATPAASEQAAAPEQAAAEPPPSAPPAPAQ